MKKLVSFFLCILVTTFAYAQNIYVCTGDNVNVRTGPGKQYPNVMHNIARPSRAQIFKGQEVEYLGVTKNGFMKVSHPDDIWQGGTGWVSAQYLRRKGAPSPGAASALERKVIGRHMLSLQWISWDYFGTCNITKEADGRLRCVGEQLSKEHPGDYLKLDGYVSIVDAKHLIFDGDISIRVYHLNDGEPYTRSGQYDFVSTNNRKYWRAQNLEIIDACDYVDIYFK